MNEKESFRLVLMNMIDDTSKKIRSIEDDCLRFSVAPSENRVYTAWVGYRSALQDALAELRRFNGTSRSN